MSVYCPLHVHIFMTPAHIHVHLVLNIQLYTRPHTTESCSLIQVAVAQVFRADFRRDSTGGITRECFDRGSTGGIT